MLPIYDKLKNRLKQDLPGAEAHARVSVPGRELVPKNLKPNARVSAVLLMLYEEKGVLHFPLILRPQYDGVHGGQMALPGGGREDKDQDLFSTAIRESYEEIGFTVPRTQIIGELSTFYIPPSHSLVTPVVAYTLDKPDYYIDPNEVDRVIETNVPTLQDPANFGSKPITLGNGLKMNAPAFIVDGQTVWGATAMILNEFLHVLEEAKHKF